MIVYKQGNLFDGDEDIIVHGCNCFCRMGSGVALQVRKQYPGAWEVDRETVKGDGSKLGTYTSWNGPRNTVDEQIYGTLMIVPSIVTIVNAYTQYGLAWDLPGFYADYDAIRSVMERINKDFPTQTIAMPKIGAGLAGGDWNIIERILNEVFGEREIVVYVL